MGREFKVEKILTTEDVVAYLRDLADGFEKGVITLETSAEQMVLKPGGQIKLKAEAKDKKEKEKISFKMSWINAEFAAEQENSEFEISAEEPEEVEEEEVDEEADETDEDEDAEDVDEQTPAEEADKELRVEPRLSPFLKKPIVEE